MWRIETAELWMKVIRVEKFLAAVPERVWEIISDHRGMDRWLVPGMQVRLEPEGDPPPNGRGAIRVIERFGYCGREEVLAFEAPRRMTYTVLDGFPIDDHLGELLLEPRDGGTHLVWTVKFAPRYWGTGWLLQAIVSRVLRRGLTRLPALL